MTGWRQPAVALGAAAACFGASVATRGDPMFLVEVALAAALAAWASVALVLVHRSSRLARALSGAAAERRIHGIDCVVVGDPAPRAFVAGVLRPTVFVTTGALDRLAPGELRAVLLHEAHHARTAAPMRAAFVDAWAAVAGWMPAARAVLGRRLDAFEIEADRASLADGATRQEIASALLVLDPAAVGLGFGTDSERRVRALLEAGRSPATGSPIEWLPLLVLVGLAAGCRIAGTSVGV